MRLESDELARLKALLRQAVGENGDAVAAVLAFADIEPETRTRNLRYNRLTQYALAPYGVDLSEAVSGGPEKIKPKDKSKEAAEEAAKANRAAALAFARKPEVRLLKFGQEFLSALPRQDFKSALAAARNLDFERRRHWTACSGAMLVYGLNDTAGQRLTAAELSMHRLIKKEWLNE
ncbi:TPA: hypothetical protein ACFRG5_001704 [Neisseria lactamica]